MKAVKHMDFKERAIPDIIQGTEDGNSECRHLPAAV